MLISQDIEPDCQLISKLGVTFKTSYLSNSTLTIELRFPDQMKIITQSKEIDIHTLIGNIGGYIGLFLGNTNKS